MRVHKYVIAIFVFLVLWNVLGFIVLKAMTPKSEIEFSKIYVSLFEQENYPAIKAHAAPQMYEDNESAFKQMAAFLHSAGLPDEIKTIGFKSQSGEIEGKDTSIHDLTLEYHFPLNEPQWLLVQIGLVTQEGQTLVQHLKMDSQETSFAEANRFKLTHQTPAHYAILSAAIISFLLCMTALSMCLQDETLSKKQKWFWGIFSVLGVTLWNIQWSTGAVTHTLTSFNLLGAGFGRLGLYGPWSITVGFPLGALVYLAWRLVRKSPTV